MYNVFVIVCAKVYVHPEGVLVGVHVTPYIGCATLLKLPKLISTATDFGIGWFVASSKCWLVVKPFFPPL